MTQATGTKQQVWLDVPFGEKDEAKAAGARWNPTARRWYAPRAGMAALERWAAVSLPEPLPGEDRTFGSGLFVDLVPASCWFTNVRSCITAADWERVRVMVYARAQQRCEACGAQRDPATQSWLEAHERWHYDEDRAVQTLRRLVCLCTACHETTHLGRAQVMGHAQRATAHLMQVNQWSRHQADQHIDRAFDEWTRRNRHDWQLDLSMLTDAGVTLADPPTAGDRRRIAGDSIAQIVAAPDTHIETDAAPPSDWYADPAGRFEYRWWDGAAWTEHVASNGEASTDPPW